MKPWNLAIIAGLAIGIALVAAVTGFVVGRGEERVTLERYEMEAIANRLQVPADWGAVRNHVYCNILVLGRGRGDIEEQLRRVGPYVARRDYLHPYYTVTFDNYFARLALDDLYLAYDTNDRLVEKTRWVGLGETAPMNCP